MPVAATQALLFVLQSPYTPSGQEMVHRRKRFLECQHGVGHVVRTLSIQGSNLLCWFGLSGMLPAPE